MALFLLVYFNTSLEADVIVAGLEKKGLICGTAGPNTIRIVTHLGISVEDTDEICLIIKKFEVPSKRNRNS